jgi:hypothetical protein
MKNSKIQNAQILGIFNQCSASDTFKLLTETLDTKIRDCKLDYLKEWEGNHNTKFDFYKEKINIYEAQKNQLGDLISSETVEEKTSSISHIAGHENSHARIVTQ